MYTNEPATISRIESLQLPNQIRDDCACNIVMEAKQKSIPTSSRSLRLPGVLDTILGSLTDCREQRSGICDASGGIEYESAQAFGKDLLQAVELLDYYHSRQQDHISMLYGTVQQALEEVNKVLIDQRDNRGSVRCYTQDMMARCTHAGYLMIRDKVNLRMSNERNILNLRRLACLQARHMTRQLDKAGVLEQQLKDETYTYIEEQVREVQLEGGRVKFVYEGWKVTREYDVESLHQDLDEIERSIKASGKATDEMRQAEGRELIKIATKLLGPTPRLKLQDFERRRRPGDEHLTWQI